jgi:hypothetical protein
MRQDVGETREVSHLEPWCRAKIHSDLQTWAAFQQGVSGAVGQEATFGRENGLSSRKKAA